MKYVLPLLLAGCASTPQEVMTDGPRTTHALKQALAIAAGCLARNIENHNFVYSAAVRQVDDRTTEVVVRVPAVGRTVSVARVSQSGTGSAAEIWRSPYPAYRSDTFLAALVNGC